MQRDLVDALIEQLGGTPEVFWYYTPMALAFSGHLKPEVIVYDNMDDLSAFGGAPPELILLEKQLLERSDVVFTGGRSLYEAKKGRHTNLHAFPSSIDADQFKRARLSEGTILPDQDHIPHPRLGYFGVIDERMDLDLLRQVANERPDWQFVMIGPVVKIDPYYAIPRPENAERYKRYEQLARETRDVWSSAVWPRIATTIWIRLLDRCDHVQKLFHRRLRVLVAAAKGWYAARSLGFQKARSPGRSRLPPAKPAGNFHRARWSAMASD